MTATFACGGTAFDGDPAARVLRAGGRADLMCLDYAAMSRDIIADSADETEVFMTRASARYLRTLIVAGRVLVTDGRLVSVDLRALQNELHAQAIRSSDALLAERDDIAMHRERIRAFYRDRQTM